LICTHRTGASSVSDAEKELRHGRRRRRRISKRRTKVSSFKELEEEADEALPLSKNMAQ
jgi:hypothetical protein